MLKTKKILFLIIFLTVFSFSFSEETSAATVTLDPVGPGNETNFDWNYYCKALLGEGVQNWQCALLNDGCGTCVGSNQSGVYVRDLYEASGSYLGGTINKVTVYVVPGLYTGGGYKVSLRTHNTTYDGTEVLNPSSTISYEWAQNPYTGSAWAWDEIVGLQIGVNLKWISGTLSITQVYAVVDYEPDANYGVSVDFMNGEFSGYAWGSKVIGWLSFNCSNEGVCATADYKVMTSFSPAPSITNFSNTFPAPCSQFRIPTFSWETDAELPYDYEIRLCSNSDCTGPSDPLVLELVENISSVSWVPACAYTCNVSPYNNINFGGGTYYGQIRARNTGGQWSGWTTSSFATYNHAYPFPDFLCDGLDCEEMQIYEDVVVTLSNSSITYDGALSCSWTLPDIAEVVEGNPETDCELQVKFSPPPPGQREQEIGFSVTDSSSYSCSTAKTVEIRFPLPEYKEVPPMTWLKNFFARVVNIFAGF